MPHRWSILPADRRAPKSLPRSTRAFITAVDEAFVHVAFIGTLHVASVLIGLAIGGVTGHWLVAFGVFAVATVAAIQGFMSNTRTASYVALALSLLALALTAG